MGIVTEGFRRGRMWFPDVAVRQLAGHVQGIAVHQAATARHRDRPDIGSDHPSHPLLTFYASVSDFPRGWGALLINDNHSLLYRDAPFPLMTATALPMAGHPGGLGIDGDTLVIPHEHKSRTAWISLWNLDDPLYPRQYDALTLRGGPGIKANKASAAGIVVDCDGGPDTDDCRGDQGHAQYVVVVSEGKVLRLIKRLPGRAGEDRWQRLAPRNCRHGTSAVDRWPAWMVEGVTLFRHPDDLGPGADERRFRLLLFEAPRHAVAWNVAPQRVHEFDLSVVERNGELVEPSGPSGDDGQPPPLALEHRTTRVVRPASGSIDDVLRPGFRWGASAVEDPDEPGRYWLLAVERFGNESATSWAHQLAHPTVATVDGTGGTDGDDVVNGESDKGEDENGDGDNGDADDGDAGRRATTGGRGWPAPGAATPEPADAGAVDDATAAIGVVGGGVDASVPVGDDAAPVEVPDSEEPEAAQVRTTGADIKHRTLYLQFATTMPLDLVGSGDDPAATPAAAYRWYDQHPATLKRRGLLGTWIVLTAIAAALFVAAVQIEALTWSIFLALVAAVIGLVAVAAGTDRYGPKATGEPLGTLTLLAGLVVTVAAVAALVVGVAAERQVLVGIGVFACLHLGAAAYQYVGRYLADRFLIDRSGAGDQAVLRR